jgi:hypothetical protein
VTALTVGELVTVRPLSQKTIERQRAWQQGDQFVVGHGVVIRQPFNYIGAAMTIEELHRDSAYCRVHDLPTRLHVMDGKAVAEIPRKYLKRMKGA